MKKKTESRLRYFLLALAGVRIVIGLCAIPLAPFLYREHFVVLVLMRPTKEVLLAAGFLARLGKVDLEHVVVAALPLTVLGVWHLYVLGRMYADEIKSGDLPSLARRIVSPDRVKATQKLLRKRGLVLVFLGRLAVFPSTVVAAAAGSGGVKPRPFLIADGAAALLSIAEVIGLGFALGEAYEQAGPWITVAGVVALAAIAVIVARFLRRH